MKAPIGVLGGVSAAGILLAASPAAAHHSPAMFDRAKEITLTGEVKEFQWMSPHCWIQLLVSDSADRVDDERIALPTARPAAGAGSVPIQMSDKLHFIERMRMVGHDELQDEFTMEDPVALTAPYKVTLSYARVTDTDRMIDETECDSTTDRNPIVNGRFTSITVE